MVKRLKFKEAPEADLLKLDLGAGKARNTPDGYIPVDITPGKGIKVVDLRQRWPWKTNSVDEAQANYLLHFLTAPDRMHFANELCRVLKPDAKALLMVPHAAATKTYGDITAQWPPVAEAWFACLNKAWRDAQNYTVVGYTCDFEFTLAYGLHPQIVTRNQEYQQHAVTFWREAAQDLIVTLTKR